MLAEITPLILWLILSGALAGFSAGLFGVGGGAIMVPVLSTLFEAQGFSDTHMHVAVSTSLAVIIITSARSMAAHHAKGAVDWAILKGLGVWVILGAILGMAAVKSTSTEFLRIIFACFAVFASLQFFFGRPDWKLHDAMPEGAGGVIAGAGLGGLSALLGIGGGTFGVTLMTLCGTPMHRAVGTASGLGLLIGLPSALAAIYLGLGVPDRPNFSLGFVNAPAFIALCLGAILMAPIGASLAHRLPQKLLRRLFAIMLAMVALKMVV